MAQYPTPGDREFNLLQKLVANTGDLAGSGGSGGAAVWGGITGTLSNQTDLNTVLNGKQPLTNNLTSVSGLTYASLSFVKMSAAGTFSLDTNTYLTAAGAVTSIAGTAGQITASASTGAVTLSIPTAMTGITSITAPASTDLTLNAGSGANNNVVLVPSGSGQVIVTTGSNLGLVMNIAGSASNAFRLHNVGGNADFGIDGNNNAFVNAAAAGKSITFQLQGTEKARFATTTGNLLLGALITDGTGVLQLPAATTSAGGITFGTDVNLFRSATAVLKLVGALNIAAGSNPDSLQMGGATVLTRDTGTGTWQITSNAGSGILATAGVTALTLDANQRSSFTPGAIASGTTAYFKVQTPADTGLTLSTEAPGYVHLTAIRQWATGALTLQRENLFNGPTIAFVGASTLTDGFTVGITPVIQGTNATITRIHSLGILDSTSAASSITGGLIVATTFGTTATSVGIGGGNVNAGGLITGGTITSTGAFTASSTSTFTGAITQTAKTAKYNNITTAGWGQPAIYASARSTAQVAAVASVATYTVGAADGTFIVSANVNVTAATTATFSATVTYLDENNTSRTATFSFVQNGVSIPVQSITNVTGIGAYAGNPMMIRCKASTVITIATSGTFTSVTYNVEGFIEQVA